MPRVLRVSPPFWSIAAAVGLAAALGACGEPREVAAAAGATGCVRCHGTVEVVGWDDEVSGDFHGARAGAGYGGTLREPYARRQPPLPCTACHSHASANAFFIAETVNGVPVPAGSIDRAGVGAEVLCGACHQGDRHAGCMECHKDSRVPDTDPAVFEGAPVDPAPDGSACFFCHGHEGILHWTAPDPGGHADGSGEGCIHCHEDWAPPL